MKVAYFAENLDVCYTLLTRSREYDPFPTDMPKRSSPTPIRGPNKDAEAAEPSRPHAEPLEVELTQGIVAAHAEAPAQDPSGGDFHNAFAVHGDSGDVGIVIGDVAGHGPEQTAQAEHMRALLSDCLSLGMAPAETLAAVNAMIEPDPHFKVFGTVFVGTLEADTGLLTYASGGHEPGLVAAPDAAASGRVDELEASGPPVGAFPAELAQFEQQESTVERGATLLLYTDGVSDARPPHDRKNQLGTARLKSLLARFASLSPRRLVSALLKRVALFCGGRFDDDVAVVAIRRLARLPKKPPAA